MKALLVGGYGSKNDAWVRKAREQLKIDVVARWKSKSKVPKRPSGKYDAVLVMTDICGHGHSDAAKTHADKEDLKFYKVSSSLTKTVKMLEIQGLDFTEKVKQAVNRDESRRRRRWTDGECVAMHAMQQQGKPWAEVGAAFSTTGAKAKGAVLYRKQTHPGLFGLPVPEPMIPADKVAASESDWEALAKSYEAERDTALANCDERLGQRDEARRERDAHRDEVKGLVDKLDVARASLNEETAKRMEQAARIGDLTCECEELLAANGAWAVMARKHGHAAVGISPGGETMTLAELADIENEELVAAKATIETQRNRLKELEERVEREVALCVEWQDEFKACDLALKTANDRTVELKRELALASSEALGQPVNGFDVEAFRAGVDAYQRAADGDRTIVALLTLAGLS